MHKSIEKGQRLCTDCSFGLTCLLSEGGGLALAGVRHRDHADVVVDARLQAVHGVLAGRRLDKVLEEGNALAGRCDGDLVARDGGGVEGQPAEADAGVAHVLEGDVGHLRHFCGRDRAVGRGDEKRGQTETPRQTNREKDVGVGWKGRKEEKDRQCELMVLPAGQILDISD